MGFQVVTDIANQAAFRANSQETQWDVLSAAAGGTRINAGKIISRKPNWFAANNGAVAVNDTGTIKHIVGRMQLNGGNIDVNFVSGEACVVSQYPNTPDAPENNPITLTFSNPVKGAGAYVSFVSNANSLYDGRDVTAHMHVLLEGQPSWEQTACISTAKTGHHVPIGVSSTAPFVAAETTGTDLIKSVSFDLAVMGNPDFVTISRLYWIS